jgi:circadian clock protein KaiB
VSPSSPRKPGKKPARRPVPDAKAVFEKLLKKAPPGGRYVLKLYVTGTTIRSSHAVANIHALCEEHLAGRYDLEIIDLYQRPGEAADEQIIAAPTLVKKLPIPVRRIVGDLSDREKIMVGLNLAPADKAARPTQWVEL